MPKTAKKPQQSYVKLIEYQKVYLLQYTVWSFYEC